MNILEINNLSFKYKDSYIFKNFNLKIEENKFISLPSNNTITIGYSYVNNKRIHDHSREFGLVFGNRLSGFLFEEVYKEMAFPLENLNIDPKEIEIRILEVAKMFGISKMLDKKISDLTKSEKQQLLLAISLLHKPKLLLLDNPFSMMDRITKHKMLSKLREYQKENKITIILTTVNLEDTIDTDYLYILNKGNIVMEGIPELVLKEDTLLNRLGLTLPFMVDLSLKLKFYNLLDDIELDLDRMVNTLWK